jgi:NAD-dependent SIR2 family protein deacetylase
MNGETETVKCEDCGWVGSPNAISYEIYGDGKDKKFGLCPQCKGLGTFQKANCPNEP